MSRPEDRYGRRAFFSSAADTPKKQIRPTRSSRGKVVVECGSCDARTALGSAHLLRQLIPSIWLPTRRLSRLMRCPNCQRFTWCRVDWLAATRP